MFDKAGQRPDRAATLEPIAKSGIPADEITTKYAAGDWQMNPEPANTKKVSGGRFAYASGSKPLDGYTIKRGIGIGGFGEVYFALSDAGKEVAIKRIQRNLDVEIRGVQNCLNLKNVNLITLFDIRTNDVGESWVVMEYVPGPSLRDVIEDHPRGMPENQIQRWFCSTAAGVAYLHDQGIVHRDLKPANIFLDDDENVIKIGDYGLSKFISTSKKSGQTETVGTFHYMAPEIGKGIYGKEIDIYAMAILLYEMLTGDVPFEGESSQEIIMKHLTAQPNVDRLPEGYRAAILKGLMKDPERRYDTIQEFLDALPWGKPTAGEIESSYPNTTYPKTGGQNGNRKLDENGYSPHAPGVQPTTAPSSPRPQNNLKDTPAIDGATVIGAADVRIIGDGIAFGDVRDTNAGDRPPAPDIQFIDRPMGDVPIDVPIGVASGVAVSNTAPATSVVDEPIAKAVSSGWNGLVSWWSTAAISTPIRLGVMFVAGVVIIRNSQWLLPVGLGFGFLYLVYYAIRLWMLSPASQKTLETSAGRNVADPETIRLTKRNLKKRTESSVRSFLAKQDRAERLSELVGSLLIAAVACLVFNLIGMAVSGSVFDASVETWAIYAWSTVTSIFASWGILCAGKCWEHRKGDDLQRRLIMLGLGMATGLVAFATATVLNVDLMSAGSVEPNRLSQLIIANIPLFPAYLIFFTVLMGVIRWWRKADPVRRTRLSVISVGLALVWAAVFSHLLEFAPVWNCILAVVISAAVQLAAPWMHPKLRSAIELDSKTVYEANS